MEVFPVLVFSFEALISEQGSQVKAAGADHNSRHRSKLPQTAVNVKGEIRTVFILSKSTCSLPLFAVICPNGDPTSKRREDMFTGTAKKADVKRKADICNGHYSS